MGEIEGCSRVNPKQQVQIISTKKEGEDGRCFVSKWIEGERENEINAMVRSSSWNLLDQAKLLIIKLIATLWRLKSKIHFQPRGQCRNVPECRILHKYEWTQTQQHQHHHHRRPTSNNHGQTQIQNLPFIDAVSQVAYYRVHGLMVWGFKRWLVRKKRRKTRKEMSGWPLLWWVLLGFVFFFPPFSDWSEGGWTANSICHDQTFIQRSFTRPCRNGKVCTILHLLIYDREVFFPCVASLDDFLFANTSPIWTVQTSFIELS